MENQKFRISSKEQKRAVEAIVALQQDGVTEFTGYQFGNKMMELQPPKRIFGFRVPKLFPGFSNLYHVLSSLEEQRVIASRWDDETSPKKPLYTIVEPSHSTEKPQ